MFIRPVISLFIAQAEKFMRALRATCGSKYALAFVNNANRTTTLNCSTSCIRALLDDTLPAASGYSVRQTHTFTRRFSRASLLPQAPRDSSQYSTRRIFGWVNGIISSASIFYLSRPWFVTQVRDLWEKRSLASITATTGLALSVAGGGAVRLVTLTATE